MDIKVNQNTIIVFDLDDTLYNEIEFLKSAYWEIAQQMERKNWRSLYAYMISMYKNNKDAFEYLSNRYNISKTILLATYREHQPSISLFPSALQTLKRIKKNGGNIGIITDGRKITQTNKIKALGLFPLVDHVVISEEIGTEKPHQNNYNAMEELFGQGSYYYIADNVKKDFISPNAMGWKTIGLIDNGLNIHSDAYLFQEKKYQPMEYITSFDDLKII